MSAKTVFISYRRDALGKAFARSIKQELTRNGYDVFFDVDSIDAGKWAAQILTQVPARSHFLLLLTPGALDRCVNQDDWVRREFETAVQCGRNIVPIREESVDLNKLKQDCPEEMKGLFDFQIATLRQDGFDSDIEDLIERYIPPHKAPAEGQTLFGAFRADISRIIKYAPAELIGREAETKLLADAWDQAVRGETKRPHVLIFVALGGEGKTSLVAKWAVDLAHQDWPGCDAAFAWSFYSQGTREQTAVSSDAFLAEALKFFGDEAVAGSAQGAFDKGRRLAQLVGEQRALLILDGLEPLQYAPTSPTPGELKDQGIAALLKGLAATSHGLCVVTTRYAIPDLRAFIGKTVQEEKLTRLSTEAGVALLKSFEVNGSLRKTIPSADGRDLLNEFEKLVEDVKGHALTLNLLGSYLRDAHAGDIRRRDLIKLEEADSDEQGGHAFHVMDAYVKSLESGGKTAEDNAKGRRALALLKLLGLFDRPASADCLNALWTGQTIAGLTAPLIGISEAHRNISLKRLEDAKLLTVNRAKGSGELLALDAHPLLREYFALRVREHQPEAWRAAHRRVFEHLCATTKEGDEPTLEELQPLYQAVGHGCQARMQEETFNRVFFGRIHKGTEYYAYRKLGAFGSNLGALACFFDHLWDQPSTELSPDLRGSVLAGAGYDLRATGRLIEAKGPIRAARDEWVQMEDWKNAAVPASNLAQLELTLGEVAEAVRSAEQSVTYADRSGNRHQQITKRTTLADSLHQAGRRVEAEACFCEAEKRQAEFRPEYPQLFSLSGFLYCDLLLAEIERAAWQRVLNPLSHFQLSKSKDACRAVEQRTTRSLEWRETAFVDGLLELALDHLTLGQAALYASILEFSRNPVSPAAFHIAAAVDGLRRAATQDEIPRGLLTLAWLRFLDGDHSGVDLNEAWEMAERGPMKLFMTDIHLYRARLFHDVKPYPWHKNPDGTPRGPKDDLNAARKLIEQCGYWRRKEELEDAEAAAKNW